MQWRPLRTGRALARREFALRFITMLRVLHFLILFLGLTSLGPSAAAAASTTHPEMAASGSADVANNLVGIEPRLSEEAVREKVALAYELASDDAVAARAVNQAKAFEKAGIQTTEHSRNRLAQRAGRGITESNALDAYRNGRRYYNEATGNYVRHSSRTGVSVVTDAPTGGRAITVFEGSPSPGWNPVPWRPGQ